MKKIQLRIRSLLLACLVTTSYSATIHAKLIDSFNDSSLSLTIVPGGFFQESNESVGVAVSAGGWRHTRFPQGSSFGFQSNTLHTNGSELVLVRNQVTSINVDLIYDADPDIDDRTATGLNDPLSTKTISRVIPGRLCLSVKSVDYRISTSMIVDEYPLQSGGILGQY